MSHTNNKEVERIKEVVEENFNQLKISSDNHLAINAPEQIAYCDALDDALPIVVKFLHQELQKAREEERERIKTTIETLLLGVQPLPEDADSFMGEHEKTVVQAGYMVKEWVMEAFEEPDQAELDQDKQ